MTELARAHDLIIVRGMSPEEAARILLSKRSHGDHRELTPDMAREMAMQHQDALHDRKPGERKPWGAL